MINSRIKKVFRYLIADDENFSLENKLFISSIAIGLVICILGSIINLILSTSLVAVLIPLLLSGMLLILLYYIRAKKIIEPFILPVNIVAILGISTVWVFNGGINGANILPAFVILILALITVSDKTKPYILVLFLSTNIFINLIQYFRPDLIISFPTETDRWIDSLLTLIYSSLLIFFIIRFIHKHYTIKRLRAEENENKFRILYDNSPDMYISVSPVDATILTCNQTLLKNLGYAKEEVIGKSVFGMYHEDSLDEIKKTFQQFVETGKVKNKELIIKRKDGSKIYVSINTEAVRDENQKILYSISSWRDISEQKKAEQALKHSEEKYGKIIETTSKGFCLLDNSGKIIDVNPAYCEYSGYSKNELREMYISDLEISENAEEVELHIKNIIQNGHDRFETTHKRKNKTIFPVEIETSYLPLNNGLFIAFITDITERKHTEQVLKESEKQLLQLNTDKDTFISILAHDLQNPFNALIGFSDMLMNNLHSIETNELGKYLAAINTVTHQTYNLFEDLLIWTKSQSGKLPFEPKKINFHEICAEIITAMSFQANVKKIKLNFVETEKIILFVDINMFKTILRNLVANAIKFTHENGSVVILANRNDDEATITVSDNGVGIEKENQMKLWNLAQQFTTKGTAKESGTGFGLMLCKEFIEKHGGKIWVESEVGKGSDFKFTLPNIYN